MRSAFGLVVVLSACSAFVACEDLGGLRGGDGDGGAPSDAAPGTEADARVGSDAPDDANTVIDAGPCDPGPVSSGLALYLPFDDGAGSTARDCGPSKLTAAVGGTKTWAAGKRGGALVFDGTSTCVTLPDDPAFPFDGPFSLAAWVNVTSFPTTQSSKIIIGRSIENNDDGFRLAADDGDAFDMKVGEPGDALFFRLRSEDQPTSTWRHVAVVYEPGSKAVLFLDGSPTDTETMNIPSVTIDPGSSLRVGCGSQGNFFHGSIDDVRVYTRALSAVDLAMLASP